MQTIDEGRLEQDLVYRYQYLTEFIGFSDTDRSLIQGSAPYLGPLIPELVERTYERLLSYNATARHFVTRQAGYDGPLPDRLEELSAHHPQIQFRKEHLSRYFMQILGRSFDDKMVLYLDMVGKIHTPRAGNPEIVVPLVQMNALMGLLSAVVTEALAAQIPDGSLALQTIQAYQKLFWIQNDFITRHYAAV